MGAYGAGLYGEGIYGIGLPFVPVPTDPRWWTHVLAGSLGLDGLGTQPVVEVRTYAAGAWTRDADLSHAAAGYTVSYGRPSAIGPADPLQASLTLATQLVPTTPAIGTRLQIALCDAVADELGLTPDEAVRFTGEVTDPSVSHSTHLTRLILVGRGARGARIGVDGTSWPAEDDGARVLRILTSTGVALDVGSIDAGTVTLRTPARAEPAGRLLERAVVSTGGQLIEQPTGDLDWHNADHRRGITPATTLTANEVFRDITWSQRLADLVNDVDVAYQTGTIKVVDPASADPVAGYGPYPAALDTDLVEVDDAYALGTLVIGRRALPAWQLPDLTIDLTRTIPLGQLPEILTLRHADRLELTGLPDGCPVPAVVIVEGYAETATPSAWRLSVSVSDPLLSGVALRWIDVEPVVDWDDVTPGLTWLDLARIEQSADIH